VRYKVINMAPLNEEQAAEILWQYLEAAKKADAPDAVNFETVTRAELEELAGVMKTAGDVAQALAEEARVETSKEAARQKFRAQAAALAQEPPAALEEGRATLPATGGERDVRGRARAGFLLLLARLLPALGWACALLLAIILILPHGAPARDTEPPDPGHAAVLASLKELVRGEVPAERARELWAHLVHCDMCFAEYRKKWQSLRGNTGKAEAARAQPRRIHEARSMGPDSGGLGGVGIRALALPEARKALAAL
jgi:hypothetical protein